MSIESEKEEQRLDDVIAEYFELIETGKQFNFDEWAYQHSRFRQELNQFFRDRELFESRAAPMRIIGRSQDSFERLSYLDDLRILEEIGRGGMGVVYRAEQISLRRQVAVKVLPFAAILDAKQLQRFRYEVRAAALLKHPHIVSVFSVGCDRGFHYYTMELVEGVSIANVIQTLIDRTGNRSELTESGLESDVENHDTSSIAELTTLSFGKKTAFFSSIAAIGERIAMALHYAHEQGVVHRDIKPSNLLIDNSGTPYVTDFGLAHVHGDEGLTMAGELLGTLQYMSPEQAEGKTLVDARSDIYSLGATLYELLTLKTLFSETNRQALLSRIVENQAKSPRRINRFIPVDLEKIILKALAKEPNHRYQTAQEMADDLRRFIEQKPILARRSNVVRNSWRWTQRNPLTAILLASITMLLLGLAVAGPVVAWKQAVLATNEANSREEALRSKADAELSRRELQEFLNRSVLDVAERVANQPGMGDLTRQVLEDGATYYDRLIERHRDNDEIGLEAAMAYQRLGRIYRMTNRPEAAYGVLEKSISVLTELHSKNPITAKYRSELAATHRIMGNHVFWELANEDKGILHLQRAVSLLTPLIDENSDDATLLVMLNYHRCMLGSAMSFHGRRQEGQKLIEQAVRSAKKLTIETAHANESILGLLVFCLNFLSNECILQRQFDEAQKWLDEVESLAPRFSEETKQTREGLAGFINHRSLLGKNLLCRNEFDQSYVAFGEALEAGNTLLRDFPEYGWGKKFLSFALIGSSDVFIYRQRHDKALETIRSAVSQWESVNRPDLPEFRRYVAFLQFRQAQLYWWKGEREHAVSQFHDAIQRMESMVNDFPNSIGARRRLANMLVTCPVKSLRKPRRAVQIIRDAMHESDEVAWQLLGIAQYRSGQYHDAIRSLTNSINSNRGDAIDWLFLAMSCHQSGDLSSAGKWWDRLQQAKTDNEPVGLENFNHPSYVSDLIKEAEMLIRGTAN